MSDDSPDPVIGYADPARTIKGGTNRWATLYFQALCQLAPEISLEEAIRMANAKPDVVAEDPWQVAQRDIKEIQQTRNVGMGSLDFLDGK